MHFAVPLALALLSAAPQEPVVVAAAADLQFVMPSLVGAFEAKHPGFHVDVVTGSSGTFFAQLQRGAPFDVFLSADVDYVDRLVAAGLADASSRFVYGNGRLVLYVHDASLLSTGGIDIVGGPRVGRLALANPRHAPYGRAAEAALKRLGLYESARAKFVFGENVAQTTQFVDSGAADAGFTALAIALSPALRGRGAWVEVPPTAYPPIVQGGCVLKGAAHERAARAFRAFLVGDEARELLSKAGFVVDGPPAAKVEPVHAP